jgi:hypothetical protein
MEHWSRRDLLKLGILLPAGAVSLRWAEASSIERDLALNRAAWASSSVDFIQTGHMSTDGQPTTQWQSADSDLQWVYVDLGAVCEVHSVVLRWGANYALEHKIQVSMDGGPSPETGLVEGWNDVHAVDDGKGGVEQISLAPARARYLRLFCSQRARTGGYELSVFEVYGTGGFEPVPTPMPTPERDGTLRLSGGWRLVNQAYIQGEAATISTPGYNDSQWLIAMVPGTVQTTYQNLGAIPDMFYADHQYQVSDFFAHTNWWYRNEFEVPPSHLGKRTWLNFDGINYRAYIYVNGNSVGSIDGAFIRGRFDISKFVTPGKKNCSAVLIRPVPKPDKVDISTLVGGFNWPEEYPANEPTILGAGAWDWLPTIRDRDTGIWNHVTLTASGDATIENPVAITHFPEPQNLHRADVTLKLQLKNHSHQTCKGTLKARLGEIECIESVSLSAGETRELSLDKSSHPQLSLVDPKLWWPSGYGEQNLHDLVLEFRCGDKLSDIHQSRVGIREYTYNTPSLTQWDVHAIKNVEDLFNVEVPNPLAISCNGQRIFIRGVNWAMDEGMLRCDRQGFENRLRMEKEMNFNLIRSWGGNLDKPEFFELCDEYGLMVWEEFGMANQIMPDDPGMWLVNARDRFLRRRNHACIVLWCSANESIPDDPIFTEMPKIAKDLDGTRLFLQCSTQTPPTNGDGPYTTKPPSYYFNGLARGFRPELGSPVVPCVESMRRMMPHNKLWPINELWGLHDWWLGTRWGGAGVCGPTAAAIEKYGAPAGIEDFCRQAQLVNLEVLKAIYEAWNDRMWNDCTGVMIWMSNPAWPSLNWNTYDYYGEPTAAYFGCRKACEPIHIQWNPVTNDVKAVNCTLQDRKGLVAEAEIYNLDGGLFQKSSAALDCPANSVQKCLRLFASGEENNKDLSDVHFIKLTLKSGNGELLSSNFYWRGKTEWEYKDLQKMKECQVAAKVGELKNNRITVDLQNVTPAIVLMARIKLVDLTTGQLVAPVFYSDNYFSLVPHESKRIDIHLNASSYRKHGAALMLEGWNIKPIELARIHI